MTISDQKPSAVKTAFLVIQHSTGEWEATPNIDSPVMPEHPASVLDMKSGCAVVHSDIHTSEISAMVVQQMMAVTARISEQAQAQAIRNKLKV